MIIQIVILNWNGVTHLKRFLPSVVAHRGPAEIVIADNGSDDGSLAFLREHYPDIRVVELDRNYGYAEGYNRALAQVEADYYVLLNSDVETPPGWIEPLLARLEADPQLISVSPKIRSYERPAYFEYAGAAGGFIDMLGYPFCRGRILDTIEEDKGQYDTSREVFWTSGACMVVRAKPFLELGGFDGDFFAHMEEIDFCWRAHLAGYKSAVETSSQVYHLGGGTLPNNSPRKLYLNYRNNLSMLYKNLPWAAMVLTLTARTLLDMLSAFIFLLQRRWDFFQAVFRAHLDFHKQAKTLRQARLEIQGNRTCKYPQNIYRGSIILRHMFGRRIFDNLL